MHNLNGVKKRSAEYMLIAFSPARDATIKTFKLLIHEQRCQIYALSKSGMSQNKIAKQLKDSQSTISREFFCNTGKRGYRLKQAQKFTDTRRFAWCKAIKMTTALIALIETKLTEKWSPEQYLVGLGKTRVTILAMKLFISTFGLTNNVVATHSNIYEEKVKLIHHVVRINKLAERRRFCVTPGWCNRCAMLLKDGVMCQTLLTNQVIPLTNNKAERSLRSYVL